MRVMAVPLLLIAQAAVAPARAQEPPAAMEILEVPGGIRLQPGKPGEPEWVWIKPGFTATLPMRVEPWGEPTLGQGASPADWLASSQQSQILHLQLQRALEGGGPGPAGLTLTGSIIGFAAERHTASQAAAGGLRTAATVTNSAVEMGAGGGAASILPLVIVSPYILPLAFLGAVVAGSQASTAHAWAVELRLRDGSGEVLMVVRDTVSVLDVRTSPVFVSRLRKVLPLAAEAEILAPYPDPRSELPAGAAFQGFTKGMTLGRPVEVWRRDGFDLKGKTLSLGPWIDARPDLADRKEEPGFPRSMMRVRADRFRESTRNAPALRSYPDLPEVLKLDLEIHNPDLFRLVAQGGDYRLDGRLSVPVPEKWWEVLLDVRFVNTTTGQPDFMLRVPEDIYERPVEDWSERLIKLLIPAPRKELPPTYPTWPPPGFLDGGRLDPAWFPNRDLGAQKPLFIDYRRLRGGAFLFVKPGFTLKGHTLKFAPWEGPVFLRKAVDSSATLREAYRWTRDFPGLLQDAFTQAFRILPAKFSRTEGDLVLAGRVVEMTDSGADGSISFDVKVMDAASGEIVAAAHHTCQTVNGKAPPFLEARKPRDLESGLTYWASCFANELQMPR